jgi:hypothetical protein
VAAAIQEPYQSPLAGAMARNRSGYLMHRFQRRRDRRFTFVFARDQHQWTWRGQGSERTGSSPPATGRPLASLTAISASGGKGAI